jgi:uncharacterized protein DUF6496
MPVTQGREGVRQEMHRFKRGELHSGSHHGPIVTDRKQAIAIALNEAGLSRRNRTPERRRHTLREIRQHRRH